MTNRMQAMAFTVRHKPYPNDKDSGGMVHCQDGRYRLGGPRYSGGGVSFRQLQR